jgi:hypothetical protein
LGASRIGRSHFTSHRSLSHYRNRAGKSVSRATAHNNRRPGNRHALQHAALMRHNGFYNSRFGRGRDRGNWNGYGWDAGVFWPYFFGDYFSFAFWPGDYGPFWDYGPDVILWGGLWPYGESPYGGGARKASRPAENSAAAAGTCSGFAPGVAGLPVEQLSKIVDATEDQRAAFEDLKAAVAKASDVLKESCPAEAPLTPAARLDAMEHRLQAMQAANEAVRGPLERLYNLFTAEQKQRLDKVSRARTAKAGQANIGQLCSDQAGLTDLPADEIANTITLDSRQQRQLENLKSVSAQVSAGLKSSCPSAVPETVDARLDAAQKRVAALIQAVDTVRPAVRDFYTSLTDEQKAALSTHLPRPGRG